MSNPPMSGGTANDLRVSRLPRPLVIAAFSVVMLLGWAIFHRMRAPWSQTPAGSNLSTAEIPNVPFKDITAEAGVRFVHDPSATPEKLLPQTMGGGVAFFDFDNDGDPDLLFVTSGPLGSTNPTTQSQKQSLVLYRNDGKGHFTDVTQEARLAGSFYGMGIAAGDFNNDGWVDLFVTAVGGNHLFENHQGQFTEITTAAGVAGTTEDWSTSAAWIDYDNDGRLDLFVCNYVRWSREIDLQVGYQLPGIGRAYGPPMSFQGSYPYLYHNDGNGHFSDVSARSGVQIQNAATGLPMAKSLGVAPVDLDDDGFIDLIVANDTVQNFVFHNERNGTFREMGGISGLALDPFGGTRGAMGIDAGRFQADNTLGVSIGNFANEMTALYVSKNNALIFTDEALTQGIGAASRSVLTFGVFFFDYDLDGWLDLLTSNGHIEPEIARAFPNQRYAQAPQLFWNARSRQKSVYLPVPIDKTGPDLRREIVGRGSAFADIDGDGDLDIILTQASGSPLLLRNDQRLGHHWLRLKVVGTRANRDGIGAWIKARIGHHVFSQQVMPTRGYLSQSELTVTLGLGKATVVDDLSITWPGGAAQKIPVTGLDRVITVKQKP